MLGNSCLEVTSSAPVRRPPSTADVDSAVGGRVGYAICARGSLRALCLAVCACPGVGVGGSARYRLTVLGPRVMVRVTVMVRIRARVGVGVRRILMSGKLGSGEQRPSGKLQECLTIGGSACRDCHVPVGCYLARKALAMIDEFDRVCVSYHGEFPQHKRAADISYLAFGLPCERVSPAQTERRLVPSKPIFSKLRILIILLLTVTRGRRARTRTLFRIRPQHGDGHQE